MHQANLVFKLLLLIYIVTDLSLSNIPFFFRKMMTLTIEYHFFLDL